jgi:cation transport regulator ChaB
MPVSRRYGRGDELPRTLQRSCREAQELFASAYHSAVQTYGEGDRALRVAFSTLKERFEKRGDHWVAKRDA